MNEQTKKTEKTENTENAKKLKRALESMKDNKVEILLFLGEMAESFLAEQADMCDEEKDCFRANLYLIRRVIRYA